jgi:DNA polymerase-3 subunit beta
MKLEVLQEELNKGLGTALRFVSPRPQLPILANILLKAEKNKLIVAANNLETGIKIQIAAKTDEEGSVTVPAKEVAEFVSYLPVGKITLEKQEGNKLRIFSPQAEASFLGLGVEDFPQIPQPDKTKSFPLSFSKMAEAVSQVAFAAADDESRPILAGIYWQMGNNNYRMVATDGYRLSLKDVKLEKKEKSGKSVFLVPAKALSEVVRLGDGEFVTVGLTEKENQVAFVFPQVTVVSRLLEGEFPQYENIMPKQFKTKVWLDKQDFLQAVRIASVFARQAANIVVLDVVKKEMVVSPHQSRVGENKVTVPIRSEGEAIKTAFNYRFLLDFLNSTPADQEEIMIEFNDPLSPTVFRLGKDGSWIHIIMPVRLDQEE